MRDADLWILLLNLIALLLEFLIRRWGEGGTVLQASQLFADFDAL